MIFKSITIIIVTTNLFFTSISYAKHRDEYSLLLKSFDIAAAYDCSKKTCRKIKSCKEACYKLKVCGQKIRDGDNDGIPCENLCSRKCR